MMKRSEHIQWCKSRALEYCKQDDLKNAFGSIASDLRKHPETEKHIGLELGMRLLMAGQLDTREKMKKFINGFN